MPGKLSKAGGRDLHLVLDRLLGSYFDERYTSGGHFSVLTSLDQHDQAMVPGISCNTTLLRLISSAR
jgi:hypothetical protein